ncbi:twin-arginine translocation signal domain-containing protein, partial [candidate division KSB1 bacterium]|nr:twin-arginine translocation signal domain-containing protein [candidate division KSB1 bacterium]
MTKKQLMQRRTFLKMSSATVLAGLTAAQCK